MKKFLFLSLVILLNACNSKKSSELPKNVPPTEPEKLKINVDSLLIPVKQKLQECDAFSAAQLLGNIINERKDFADSIYHVWSQFKAAWTEKKKSEFLAKEDDVKMEKHYTSPLSKKLKGTNSIQAWIIETSDNQFVLYFAISGYNSRNISGPITKYTFRTDTTKYELDAWSKIIGGSLEKSATGDKPHLQQINEYNYKMLHDIATSKNTKIRYKNRDAYEDREISVTEKKAIIEAICFYNLVKQGDPFPL